MKKTVIIGAGALGASLLRELIKLDSIEIAGIMDYHPDATSSKIAKELNVPFYTDIKQVCLIKDLDFIIDATKSEECKLTPVNRNVSVLNSREADLMLALFRNCTAMYKLYSCSQSLNEALNELHDAVKNAAWLLDKIDARSQNIDRHLH